VAAGPRAGRSGSAPGPPRGRAGGRWRCGRGGRAARSAPQRAPGPARGHQRPVAPAPQRLPVSTASKPAFASSSSSP
jgi:hypothetical protein